MLFSDDFYSTEDIAIAMSPTCWWMLLIYAAAVISGMSGSNFDIIRVSLDISADGNKYIGMERMTP